MNANASLPTTPSHLPSLRSLDEYIQAVYQLPMLSEAEEQALAQRFREHNDLDAARRLVLAHLRCVVKMARGYQGYGLSQADLIQEGNIGLMKAVKRFDPSVGVRLVSFAMHWIRAEIHQFILRNWRMLRIATTKAQRKLFFKLRSLRKGSGPLRQKEAREIAQRLEVPIGAVLEMEQRLSARELSLDSPAQGREEGASALELPDPNTSTPEELLAAQQEQGLVQSQLRTGLDSLDARSREIIEWRWLAEPKKTLRELSERHGISLERVRQIENKALQKLRAAFEPA